MVALVIFEVTRDTTSVNNDPFLAISDALEQLYFPALSTLGNKGNTVGDISF